MTKEQLLALLGRHERNFVERKSEGVTASELRQTVCAFANSVPEGRAGVLFIGIHDTTGDVWVSVIRTSCRSACATLRTAIAFRPWNTPPKC